MLIGVGRPAPAALRAQRAVLLVFAGRPGEAADAGRAGRGRRRASPAEEVVVCGQLAMLTSMLAPARRRPSRWPTGRCAASGRSADPAAAGAGRVARPPRRSPGLVADAVRPAAPGRRAGATAGPRTCSRGELALTRVVLDWLGGRWDAGAGERAHGRQPSWPCAAAGHARRRAGPRWSWTSAPGAASWPWPRPLAGAPGAPRCSTWPACTPGRWPATWRPRGDADAAAADPARRAATGPTERRTAACCWAG